MPILCLTHVHFFIKGFSRAIIINDWWRAFIPDTSSVVLNLLNYIVQKFKSLDEPEKGVKQKCTIGQYMLSLSVITKMNLFIYLYIFIFNMPLCEYELIFSLKVKFLYEVD